MVFYTVEITNPEPCTALSGTFVWSTISTQNIVFDDIKIYPKPNKQYGQY